MFYAMLLLIIGLIIGLLWINRNLKLEMRRNRILQGFIAGIIRVISDYRSRTDRHDEIELPNRATQLPIPYETVLENIDWELSKDLLLANYEKWLKENRNIFFDEKEYGDDGFNFFYLDFFDEKLRRWHSNELISDKKKQWLSEEIVVTKENAGELEGEIGMLHDLLTGKLDSAMYTPENIDEKFATMFNHIRPLKLEEAKKQNLIRKHV